MLTYFLSFFFNINCWPPLPLFLYWYPIQNCLCMVAVSLWKAFGTAVCTWALLHFPQVPPHSRYRNPLCFCGHSEAVSSSETCVFPAVHPYHHCSTDTASLINPGACCGCFLQSCFYFTVIPIPPGTDLGVRKGGDGSYILLTKTIHCCAASKPATAFICKSCKERTKIFTLSACLTFVTSKI